MAENKKEGFLVKIYLAVLFLCGIALWFSFSAGGKSIKRYALQVKESAAEIKQTASELKQTPPDKNEVNTFDLDLEKSLQTTLVANGIDQTKLISQYAREKKDRNGGWTQFYKKIRLSRNAKTDKFENSFAALARTFKTALKKNINEDKSVTYTFYSSKNNREYSFVTFVFQAGK
jgi:hypothetical protein